jgi:predicted GNAT family acetyltransferase
VNAPSDDDAGAYFATVSDGSSTVAAVFHGAAGAILLTSAPDAAVALIADDLANRGRQPQGVVGPLDQCEVFARAWHQCTGQVHVLRFHLRHFELSASPALAAATGRLRRPDASDQTLIVDWQLAFFEETRMPDDVARVRRNAIQRFERGQVRIWDDDGAVAFAGYGDVAAATARIAPVYTSPRFRGRGYASAMVGELSRELLAAGKRAILLSADVANPTSNSIYRRIGFRPVADYFHFDLVDDGHERDGRR